MKAKIHDRIKELRSALGLSQTEFAYQSGISHSLLTKIEAGDNPPTNKVLGKLIEKWKVSEDWLITGKGELSFARAGSGEVSTLDYKDEAWTLAKEQIKKKDEMLDRLSVSFERMTEFLSRVEGSFLQPVKETAYNTTGTGG